MTADRQDTRAEALSAECVFVPPNEPWGCSTHPGGIRTALTQTVCRAALADRPEPLSPSEVEEFDRWAESRRGKGVSLGMLWALRLRATLDAARQSQPDVEELRRSFEAGWLARDKAQPHVGSPRGYAAVPVTPTVDHDVSCCVRRGCHPVCSHKCGTDLHTGARGRGRCHRDRAA